MAIRRNIFYKSAKSMIPFTFSVNSGASGTFTIPVGSGVFNYNIVTSDGQFFFNETGNKTITFPAIDTIYTIQVTGLFPSIRFNNVGDKLKMITISKWGDIVWGDFGAAFYNCENLTIDTTDVPNISNVTNFSSGFRKVTIDSDISLWDWSNAQNLSGAFINSIFPSSTTIDWSDPTTGTINVTTINGMGLTVDKVSMRADSLVDTGGGVPFAFGFFGGIITELEYFEMKNSFSITAYNITGSAIDDLFTSIGTANPSASITITTAQSTSGINTAIATAKGWTIVIV